MCGRSTAWRPMAASPTESSTDSSPREATGSSASPSTAARRRDALYPLFTPDSRLVLYAADQEENDTYEVFTSLIEAHSIGGITPTPPGRGIR